MASLQSAPYNLTIGTAVQVRVVAINIIGLGPISVTGGAAVSAVVPSPPLSVIRNNNLTTITQISLNWTQPASNGGSPIIDYAVSYDQGTGVF